VALEPIRQVAGDGKREQIASKALTEYFGNWKLYPTPRFFFTDFHITVMHGNGRENYIGDLPIQQTTADYDCTTIYRYRLLIPPYLL
jgi:hypothetical protein